MQRRVFAGFVLIFLTSLLVGGITAAYFSDEISLSSMAEFMMGTVDIEVYEVPGRDGIEIDSANDIVKAKWIITNTGSEDILLRAMIIEEYTDEIDTAISKNSASVSYRIIDPRIVLNQVEDSWKDRDDGYFYYNEPVESGGTVEFNLEFTVDGSWWGKGEVYLEVEAVQASNLAPGQGWPKTP